MEQTVSIIDIVILVACAVTWLLAIGSAFYCYMKNRDHDAGQRVISNALSAVNDAIMACGKKTEECENAYLELVRCVYRLEKSVGSIAGDIIAVDEKGRVDFYGSEDDEE